MDFIRCGRTIGKDETKDVQVLPFLFMLFVHIYLNEDPALKILI